MATFCTRVGLCLFVWLVCLESDSIHCGARVLRRDLSICAQACQQRVNPTICDGNVAPPAVFRDLGVEIYMIDGLDDEGRRTGLHINN